MINLKLLLKNFFCKSRYETNSHIIVKFLGIRFKFRKKIIETQANIECYNIIGNNNTIIYNDSNLEGIINGLNIEINGNNNTIILKGNEFIGKCLIKIEGNNNKVTLKKTKFTNCSFSIKSSDNIVDIKENCNLCDLHASFCCGDKQILNIGYETTCHYNDIFLHEECASLSIGNDCMLSGCIIIWTTDGHAIMDKTTKQILNKPSKVVIGNHVWIGFGAYLCKNAKISNNSIVGARSVVTKNFNEENIIIAGNPAKIIKRNIEWDRTTATEKEKELSNINNSEDIN